jgi:tetratricopeptide (TPR) repeat protein
MRRQMLESVAELLLAVSALSPLVVYFNDLQWARLGTIDLVASLVRLIRERERGGQTIAIAVLGSFRDDEVDGRPLSGLLSMLRDAGAHETALLPLPAQNVEALLCSMLGVSSLPEAFVARIASETAGSPFFVEEVMRILVDNGSVYLEDGAWAASKAVGELEIPTTMTHVFMRRFSFLSDAARGVLELLSASARPTAPALLTAVSGLSSDAFHQGLKELEQKRIVAGDDRHYHVAHDRMRESVYANIDAARRGDIHLRFGRALEQASSETGERVFELAYHFRRSPDRAASLRYAVTAGEKAKREFAHQVAIDSFEQALELLAAGEGGAERAVLQKDVSEQLGDLYFLTGDYDRSARRFEHALEQNTEPITLSRLHRKMGQVFHGQGDYPRMVETLWRVVGLLGGRRLDSRRGSFWFTLGALWRHVADGLFPRRARPAATAGERGRWRELSANYMRLGYAYYALDPIAAIGVTLEALACGERAGASDELCHSLAGAGVLYSGLTLHGRARRYGARSLALAQQIGSKWQEANAHGFIGIIELNASDWAACGEHSGRAIALSTEFAGLHELATGYQYGFLCTMYRGRLREAQALSRAFLERAEGSKSNLFASVYLMHQGAALAKLGEREAGLALLERALAVTETSQARDAMLLCQTRMWMGDVHLCAGDLERAIDLLELAKETRERHLLIGDEVVPLYSLLARAQLARAKVLAREPAAARVLLKRAGKNAEKARRLARWHPNFTSPALLADALWAWQAGKQRYARRQFRRAIDVAVAQDARYCLAQAYAGAGECLGRADYLREAAALFAACGAGLDLARPVVSSSL